jgi:hypothetical protein
MAYDIVRGKTILFGGFSDINDTTLGDMWEWNGTNWTQLSPVNPPPSRSFFSMTYDSARQRIVIFGGGERSSLSSAYLNDTWEWDGTNWTEITPATRPYKRHSHAMAYDPIRQRTVLYGGVFDDRPYSYGVPVVWEWDGSNWTPYLTSTRPGERFTTSMAYDSVNQRVIMFR